MKIIKTIKEIRETTKEWRKQGLSIGFVPTMGFLHQGHASLIEKAKLENDKVIVSIFVNPIQFGKGEDFDVYPRDLKRDSVICEEKGADIIFNPEREEMYNDDFTTFVDLREPAMELCGKSREGHFKGVCTVVSKLFLITTPDRAYFGKKDAQQLAVITQMVKDLNFGIEVIGCEIIREEDGLAMSSRNTYLSNEERKAALVLNRALKIGKDLVLSGEKDTKIVKNLIINLIEEEPLAKIDYVDIVSFPQIKKMDFIDGPILTAVAVYFGKTRLIDNFIISSGM